MSHGFPISPRSSQLNYSSRCFYKSHSELRRGTSPRLSIPVPLAPPQRSHSLPSLLGHPKLRFRDNPPSSSNPQNSRDFSPVQPLVLPSPQPLHSHVHETLEVPQTCGLEPKLQRKLELSTHCGRHRPLPRDLSLLSLPLLRLHARRFNVFQSCSDFGSFPQLPKSRDSLLQLGGAPRSPLHRSLTLPRDLHLQNFRTNTPLCPGISPRRIVQSAPTSPVLAEDRFDSPLLPPTFCNQTGILGPRPLTPHPTWTPPRDQPCLQPSSSTRTHLSNPSKPSSTLHRPTLPNIRAQRQSGFIQNSRLPRAPSSHLPPTTPQTPACTNLSVQRPLHLHPGSANPTHVRPSRVRKNPKQQTRTFLGHSKRMGQSPNLCAFKRPPPPSGMLPFLLKPNREAKASFRPTLASISFGSHPIPFHVPSSPPLVQFQLPLPSPQATFHILEKALIPNFAIQLPPTDSTKLPSVESSLSHNSNKSTCSTDIGHFAPTSVETQHSPPPTILPGFGMAQTAYHATDSETKIDPPPTFSPNILTINLPPSLPSSNPPSPSRQLSSTPPPSTVPPPMELANLRGDESPVLSPISSPSSSNSGFFSASSPPRFPCYPPAPFSTFHTPPALTSPQLPPGSSTDQRSSVLQRLLELHLSHPYFDDDSSSLNSE
ncbi:putative movement protein [Naranjilla mild mosaic virus]|uniref:Putative movement protein n=1 Tax=Naranjilla mild mosaic virus TaxID=2304463 RepID=A0A385Z8T5_9VIRU|nr:putative movement protein [Naranjilla mild mosaic virus]AYC35255.1 putative movement protein [Naranjilla mild mosaic virus]